MKRSNRKVRADLWIVLTCTAIIAGVCMAPVFVMVILARVAYAALSSLGDAFFGGLLAEVGAALLAVFLWITYEFLLILGFEWGRLVWLLLALLGWLLSVGPP